MVPVNPRWAFTGELDRDEPVTDDTYLDVSIEIRVPSGVDPGRGVHMHCRRETVA